MKARLLPALAVALAVPVATLAATSGVDPDLLAGLAARSIGPATMSGRIADIAGVATNPDVIYVGAATGGVWRSTDGGTTFKPIFDHEKVAAVGAIAVFQANPDIIWVGTGEGNVRNSTSVGDGVYRSLDGGDTWTRVGLDNSERISRIVLDPGDADVAYVAAMGREWGENPERGVFKTTDGGKTWERVLYLDERTGCADLVMDPVNPNKLFAAMWDYRRWPWSFRSGGPGSGLFVTYDGGATWKRFTASDGLPEGELGRIGISVCRKFPDVVYALVEAHKSALCRSDDGGRTWKKVNEETNVASRPFYYADIRVDPELPDRLYNLASRLTVSTDGGKSFSPMRSSRTVHPDFHALWINPLDPTNLVVGDDGGVSISHDRGASWRFVANLPLGQFYHVNVDMDVPYHVYGGMQDNGSWRGPSTVWETGGIPNHEWQEVGYGDGFDVIPDPADSMQGYSMSQEGYLMRWNLRTGERKDIRPAGPEEVKLRFNWNAGIAIDPFDSKTLYFGSQFVYRTTDRGETWTIISPDLTTNNPYWQKQNESGGLTPDVTGAENYTTIVAISPSSVQRGVIWVGTDDGRLHVTRDSGANWTSVEGNVKGVPANTWIPHIRASRFDAGTAFVVFDNHRRSDWTPYVFKTTDFGTSWTSLASKDLWGYCLSIEQDPVDANLLFLGTEFGLYVSQDGGTSWLPLRSGLPTVAVRDLVVHSRDHDLVIATHGRAAWIVDDISPLRTLSARTMGEPLHLFPIPPAQQYRAGAGSGARFSGDSTFEGENRPYGAIITFSVADPELPLPDPVKERARQDRLAKEKHAAGAPKGAEKLAETAGEDRGGERRGGGREPRATIVVSDSNGNAIRTFKSKIVQGVNRAVWNLRSKGFKQPPRERASWWQDRGGPEVLPGTYTVTVKVGDNEAKGTVRVLADPRFHIPEADRLANWKAIQRAGALQEALAEAVRRIVETRADVDTVLRKARGESEADEEEGETAQEQEAELKELTAAGRAVKDALTDTEKLLRVPPDTRGIVDYGDVQGKIRYAMRDLSSSWDAPTPAQLVYLDEAASALAKALERVNAVFTDTVAPFREQVKAAGIGLFPEQPPLARPER
jgi:photosystem II stability/assembly factor-like uncharacterized protein